MQGVKEVFGVPILCRLTTDLRVGNVATSAAAR